MAETLVGAAHTTRSFEQASVGSSTVETRQCLVSTTGTRIASFGFISNLEPENVIGADLTGFGNL